MITITMTSRRAFTGIEIAAVLAVVALGTYATVQLKHIFAPSKPVAQVTAVDTTAQQAVAAAQSATKVANDKIAADEAERTARDKKDEETAGWVAAEAISLIAEVDPSINVRIALLMNKQAAANLPKPTAAMFQAMTDMVNGLREENKNLKDANLKLTAAYTAKAQESAVNAAKADEAKKTADALTPQLQAANAKTEALTGQVVKQADGLVQWAADHETLLSRLKAVAILAGILALVALWIEVNRRGVVGALTDTVAHAQHIQGLIAKHAPEVADKIKTEAAAWWNADADKSSQKTLAKINQIKNQLRL